MAFVPELAFPRVLLVRVFADCANINPGSSVTKIQTSQQQSLIYISMHAIVGRKPNVSAQPVTFGVGPSCHMYHDGSASFLHVLISYELRAPYRNLVHHASFRIASDRWTSISEGAYLEHRRAAQECEQHAAWMSATNNACFRNEVTS
ncbi:hypothetical protein BGY98DRAFT_933421 [Russula aff. rugulosa BPL654]|nr:hypothetical protein BGY98DRAFT_933421 [Russula aff. rugulosa BPL654]